MDDDSKPATSFSMGSPAGPSPKLLGRANLNLQARSEETRSTPEPTVKAEKVVLHWGDGTRVTADHMELRLPEENAEARLLGRVNLDVDSMQPCVDQGRIRSDGVELSGAVSFIANGIEGICTDLILTVGGIVSLVGDVRSLQGGEDKSVHRRPHVKLQAESIRLRVGDGPIVVASVSVKRLDFKAGPVGRDE